MCRNDSYLFYVLLFDKYYMSKGDLFLNDSSELTALWDQPIESRGWAYCTDTQHLIIQLFLPGDRKELQI